MGVAAKEGVKGAGLVPAREELLGGVAEEAADVGAGEGVTCDVHGEDHRERSLQVGPARLVVTRPHGAHALGAGVVGAGEDEGAFCGVVPFEHGFVRGVVEGEPVEVVDVAVFPVAVVEVVLGHGGFGPVEDGGFVHVVPEEEVGCGAFEGLVGEERVPPFAGGRVKAVDPVRGARPAPAFVKVVVFIVDAKVLGLQSFDDGIVGLVLDMWVNDGYQLALRGIQLLLHAKGVWKCVLVPSEVFFAVGVFNIKPNHIVWNVMARHLVVNVFDVLVSNVVPSALMIPNGKLLR